MKRHVRTMLVATGVLAASVGVSLAQERSQPADAGTTVGPAAGKQDVPPEPPSAEIQQPGKVGQVSPNPSSAPSGQVGQSAKMQGQSQDMGSSHGPGTGDGTQPNSSNPQAAENGTGSNRPHVTSTHELKESLKARGFSDVRILAESFVVQASKDGKRVTMVLGPAGLSAFQVVDESGMQDDDTTGSIGPQDPSAPQQ